MPLIVMGLTECGAAAVGGLSGIMEAVWCSGLVVCLLAHVGALTSFLLSKRGMGLCVQLSCADLLPCRLCSGPVGGVLRVCMRDYGMTGVARGILAALLVSSSSLSLFWRSTRQVMVSWMKKPT
jgi:hypothetical protein